MNRLVYPRYPYMPVHWQIGQHREETEALIDTGFTGDLLIPISSVANEVPPEGIRPWRVVGGATLVAPYYFGTVEFDGMGPFRVSITAAGDECLIGLGILRYFAVTLDRGRRVIVEP